MPRSVNHVASRAKRKRILKLTKGYFGARKNVWTVAKNTWEKGLTYAYRDRKNKKRTFRALWIQRINAAAGQEHMSYSQLMGALHKAGIEINRKVLADLAMNNPEAFKAIVDKVKYISLHICLTAVILTMAAVFFYVVQYILYEKSIIFCYLVSIFLLYTCYLVGKLLTLHL